MTTSPSKIDDEHRKSGQRRLNSDEESPKNAERRLSTDEESPQYARRRLNSHEESPQNTEPPSRGEHTPRRDAQARNACAVVVMGKLPRPGRVKTRFETHVTPEAAARLYAAFLDDVFRAVDEVSDEAWLRVFACDGDTKDDLEQARSLAPPGWLTVGQGEGDLGVRMERARLAAGRPHVVILGSDIPTLPGRVVKEALSVLENSQEVGSRTIVLGPSPDGGYYLVGSSGPLTPIVRGVTWSTPRVLEQTRAAAELAGFQCLCLEAIRDVDLWDDLLAVVSQLHPRSATFQVIRTLEGEGKLRRLEPTTREGLAQSPLFE